LKIIVERFSDLSPRIRKLLEKKHLPKHIQTRLKDKESILREVVNSIEEDTEVRYLDIHIKPYAYITPVEFEPSAPNDQEIIGYWRPHVLSAFIFLDKINEGFKFKVGLSSAALILTNEKELTGILGHEFLHYAYKVFGYCVWQEKESPLGRNMVQKLKRQYDIISKSTDIVSYYESKTKIDEEKLAPPEPWFRNTDIIDCIKMMKFGTEANRSLIGRIVDKWFNQNLPCLPFEIEDAEIRMKLKDFQSEKLVVDTKMLEKTRRLLTHSRIR